MILIVKLYNHDVLFVVNSITLKVCEITVKQLLFVQFFMLVRDYNFFGTQAKTQCMLEQNRHVLQRFLVPLTQYEHGSSFL